MKSINLDKMLILSVEMQVVSPTGMVYDYGCLTLVIKLKELRFDLLKKLSSFETLCSQTAFR